MPMRCHLYNWKCPACKIWHTLSWNIADDKDSDTNYGGASDVSDACAGKSEKPTADDQSVRGRGTKCEGGDIDLASVAVQRPVWDLSSAIPPEPTSTPPLSTTFSTPPKTC